MKAELKFTPVFNHHFTDLNPRACGYDQSYKGKKPNIRRFPYTSLHYVESGCGYLEKNGNVYKVNAGEIFIMCKGELVKYYTDDDAPWFYRWISFDGALAKFFESMPTVVRYEGDIFKRMNETKDMPRLREYKLLSLLYELYCEIAETSPKKPIDYVYETREFVEQNYMHGITVEGIAKELNLSRRYLSRLFKEKTGFTLSNYLTRTRIQASWNCLRSGMSVTETAFACGFSDVAVFSKSFKRFTKMSPSEYIKSLVDNEKTEQHK